MSQNKKISATVKQSVSGSYPDNHPPDTDAPKVSAPVAGLDGKPRLSRRERRRAKNPKISEETEGVCDYSNEATSEPAAPPTTYSSMVKRQADYELATADGFTSVGKTKPLAKDRSGGIENFAMVYTGRFDKSDEMHYARFPESQELAVNQARAMINVSRKNQRQSVYYYRCVDRTTPDHVEYTVACTASSASLNIRLVIDVNCQLPLAAATKLTGLGVLFTTIVKGYCSFENDDMTFEPRLYIDLLNVEPSLCGEISNIVSIVALNKNTKDFFSTKSIMSDVYVAGYGAATSDEGGIQFFDGTRIVLTTDVAQTKQSNVTTIFGCHSSVVLIKTVGSDHKFVYYPMGNVTQAYCYTMDMDVKLGQVIFTSTSRIDVTTTNDVTGPAVSGTYDVYVDGKRGRTMYWIPNNNFARCAAHRQKIRFMINDKGYVEGRWKTLSDVIGYGKMPGPEGTFSIRRDDRGHYLWREPDSWDMTLTLEQIKDFATHLKYFVAVQIAMVYQLVLAGLPNLAACHAVIDFIRTGARIIEPSLRVKMVYNTFGPLVSGTMNEIKTNISRDYCSTREPPDLKLPALSFVPAELRGLTPLQAILGPKYDLYVSANPDLLLKDSLIDFYSDTCHEPSKDCHDPIPSAWRSILDLVALHSCFKDGMKICIPIPKLNRFCVNNPAVNGINVYKLMSFIRKYSNEAVVMVDSNYQHFPEDQPQYQSSEYQDVDPLYIEPVFQQTRPSQRARPIDVPSLRAPIKPDKVYYMLTKKNGLATQARYNPATESLFPPHHPVMIMRDTPKAKHIFADRAGMPEPNWPTLDNRSTQDATKILGLYEDLRKDMLPSNTAYAIAKLLYPSMSVASFKISDNGETTIPNTIIKTMILAIIDVLTFRDVRAHIAGFMRGLNLGYVLTNSEGGYCRTFYRVEGYGGYSDPMQSVDLIKEELIKDEVWCGCLDSRLSVKGGWQHWESTTKNRAKVKTEMLAARPWQNTIVARPSTRIVKRSVSAPFVPPATAPTGKFWDMTQDEPDEMEFDKTIEVLEAAGATETDTEFNTDIDFM